jgi:hypothetical protein
LRGNLWPHPGHTRHPFQAVPTWLTALPHWLCRGTMPPMARRLFTLCSALSLLLCVATVLLWWSAPWDPRYFPSGSSYYVFWGRNSMGMGAPIGEWGIPYWLAAAATVPLPVHWFFVKDGEMGRATKGHCPR